MFPTTAATRVLICALTSSDAVRLERLIKSVELNTGHTLEIRGLVVCNTLDDTYPQQAKSVAQKYNWDCIRTESNGKPGMGKNSALQTFRQFYQQYDYMLLMDGDDFLYSSALRILQRIINHTSCDVLGLQTNDILEYTQYPEFGGVDLTVYDRTVHLYSWFAKQQNLYAMPEYYSKVVRTQKLGQHSTPDRIVLFSHEAAHRLSCSIELPVYEDYVLSLSAQEQFMLGELSYFNTSNTNIYVYDKTNMDSTCRVYDRVEKDWSKYNDVFVKETAKFEPILGDFHASEVPFICVSDGITNHAQFKATEIVNLMTQFRTV